MLIKMSSPQIHIIGVLDIMITAWPDAKSFTACDLRSDPHWCYAVCHGLAQLIEDMYDRYYT